MSLLDKGLEYFEQFHNGLDNVSYFNKLKELEDDLLDWEEDIVYVKSFFDTDQKKIFDDGLAAIRKYGENKSYLVGAEVEQIIDKLQAIIRDPIPYKKIKDIPELIHSMNEQIHMVLNEKRENAHNKIKDDSDYLSLLTSQYGVSNNTKEQVTRKYQELTANVNNFADIYKVDAIVSQSTSFKEKMESNINREIEEWQQKNVKEEISQVGEKRVRPIAATRTIQKQPVKVSKLVNVRSLSTEEEVDKYINALSGKLKQIIKENKQIEFIE